MQPEPSAATPSPRERTERALDLLRQSARVSPPLREAVDRVESELRRAWDEMASAWQSFEEADRDAGEAVAALREVKQAAFEVEIKLIADNVRLREALEAIDTRGKRLLIDQGRGLQAHITEALRDV